LLIDHAKAAYQPGLVQRSYLIEKDESASTAEYCRCAVGRFLAGSVIGATMTVLK